MSKVAHTELLIDLVRHIEREEVLIGVRRDVADPTVEIFFIIFDCQIRIQRKGGYTIVVRLATLFRCY